MNLFKKIILIFAIIMSIFLAYSVEIVSAWETVTQQDMRVWTDVTLWSKSKLDIWGGEWVDLKDNFIKTAMNYVLWIVAIITIAIFIYIWFELATAEWKQEKFTKWLKWLVYAWVWLAIIPLAFIIVKIATWFSF